MNRPTQQKSVFREWVESILFALVLAMFIRSYFFQPFKIPSGSMRPTLLEDNTFTFLGRTIVIGDHLFVNKLIYGPQVLPSLATPEFLQGKFELKWPENLEPLTQKKFPGFGQLERGDVIVFVYPNDRNKDFIKRLIAFGGETVEIKDGGVYINDQLVTMPSIKNVYYYNRGDYGAEGEKIRVPEGYLFVMGDNSGSSHDSRYWGFVPQGDVIGKAQLIFWPPNRIRLIK